MPDFAPFRGIHYDADRFGPDISALAAPPYDVIDEERRAHLRQQDERNAVHLTLPEGGERGYQAAADLFAAWRADGTLVADGEPCLYLYQVGFIDEDGRPRQMTGVIGLLSVEPVGSGEILPHERTMSKPRGDRLELLRATRANLEPIWGLSLADRLSDSLTPRGDPLLTCTDTRDARHRLYRLDDPDEIAAISAVVGGAPVVIADGHHRYATSLQYQTEQTERGRPGPGHGIMTMVVELADEQLAVRPIHRLIHGMDPGHFRAVVERHFTLEPVGPNEPDTIAGVGETMLSESAMGFVTGAGVGLLLPRAEDVDRLLQAETEAVRHVDSAAFEVAIAPLVAEAGGEISYRHDRTRVADQVRKGQADAAVLLRPVDVPTIRRVAERRERMPQKTTFFHPKPSTGLVFRSLDL